MAARIDDATHETKLYQQAQKPVSEPHPSYQPSNSTTFPTKDNSQDKSDSETPENDQYGCEKRTRPPPGAFKAMNKGTAAITILEDPDNNLNNNEHLDCLHGIPSDIALVGHISSDPRTLDEALQGPNAEDWQEALDYEIDQLKKLKMWVVKKLPHGHTPIPCSKVIKVKRGPNGEIKSYRVRIVAGGHCQVEGVNYTETFSAAAKMPTVCVVLANAAHQNWEIEHVDIKCAYLNAPLKEEIHMWPL